MTLSNKIEFTETIPKEEFIEFIEVLKKVDPKEYQTESQDGFEDLYNYWNGAGYQRFIIKFAQNSRK